MSSIVIQGFPNNGAYTRSDILGYKSYVAKFSQSGTDDPVVQVLSNDTGLEVLWTRLDVGSYRGQFLINNNQTILDNSKFFLKDGSNWEGNMGVIVPFFNGSATDGKIMIYPWGGFVGIPGIFIDSFDSTNALEEWSTLIGTTEYYLEFRIYN